MPATPTLPERIADVAELEDLLATPGPGVAADLSSLAGDIIVIGVGGKVGPTLARMAKRAAPDKRVIGVARFSDPDVRRRLEDWGVETIACDLLDPTQVAQLPRVANVVFMAGKKFGTAADKPFTWAMNTLVPGHVGDHFRGSRIVGFSTLCVYGFAPVDGPGFDESVEPFPRGEYPNSCIGRERILEYHSALHGNPGRTCRLNYAIDLRYGVLHDIALRVRNGTPIDLRTGFANVIWQGDSTSHILRCLAHCTRPSTPINIGARQAASVRAVAERFGQLFGRTPIFDGREAATAWHNDCSQACDLFGDPQVDLDTMIRWNADWLERDMPVYDLPTHYDERDGVF